MQGYILLWHGSRLKSSNDENFSIYNQLKNNITNLEIAFLELSEPSYEQAVAKLHQKGVKNIVVLPLFLAAGRHVVEDIPMLSKKLEDELKVDIKLLDHIGMQKEYISMIESILKTTPSF
ncbi:MAG: CbiX/SirB N-terminal domain-containing protein [Sulfurimonas sp.]|jgi:sirohydrochlorin cobaltochelatase|nr:CbiX/SirB N-terminal domain-containing protein [Sulfurimonadaceae bacterium]